MTRTTKDLIEELGRESKKFDYLTLVVGFEKRTRYVVASDKDGLAKLNDLVEAGGEPIGLIGATRDKNIVTIHARAFEEYEGQEWVKGYLGELVETISQDIISQVKAQSFVHGSGWIN